MTPLPALPPKPSSVPDPAQWKMIYLARRNPALAAGDFAQAWREHSALGRQCRNVQEKITGVTQCTRLIERVPVGASTGYDGVNLLRLRDRQAADDIWDDAETLAIMRPDEPRVFDRHVRDFTLVAREQVLNDGPAGGQALLSGFLRRLPRVAPADFGRALAQAGVPWHQTRRVVLNTVEPQRPLGYDFDAIVEWWFDDAEALRAALGPGDLRCTLPLLLKVVCDPRTAVFLATAVSHRRP